MRKMLPNVILGLIGAVFIVALLGDVSSPDLEMTRWGAITADDGFAFDVTNVDHSTIKIAGMTINDRRDCKAEPISFAGSGKLPVELKVGDKVTFIASCRVIRVELETDHGSASFSF